MLHDFDTSETDDPTFVLQEFMAPAAGRPASLYLAGQGPKWNQSEQGSLRIAAGESLSGDSFFNSFYMPVWSSHADIGRIGLRVAAEGSLALQIVGVDRDGVRTTAQQRDFDGSKSAVAVLWLDEGLQSSPAVRYFAELTTTTGVEIHHLDWVTDRPPCREVRLSVGLCTFNREANLKDTLTELTGYSRRSACLGDIFVVNQGQTFSDPDLVALLDQPKVAVIEQGNMGGCGGFNRSMYEAAILREEATHHLLMDDDILLDARVIDRAIRFLSHTRNDVAVGGQMLVLDDQTRMMEAGAKVVRNGDLNILGWDVDLASSDSLSVFNDDLDLDYNAWWFCVIPTSAIRQVGLSPPIFIRGDDIEYGLRLKKAGIRTVALPGVAVWHESFEQKNSDWLLYYNLRNRLISSTLHTQFSGYFDALFILGYMFNFILAHRHRAVRASLMAIRDYLAGPQNGLGPDPETRHLSIMQSINALPAPVVVTDPDTTTYVETERKQISFETWPTIRSFVTCYFLMHLPLLGRGKTLLFRRGPVHPSQVCRSTYLVPQNAAKDEYSLHVPSRRRLWIDTYASFWLVLRFLIERKGVERRWRDELPEMQSSAAWARLFSRPKGSPGPRA